MKMDHEALNRSMGWVRVGWLLACDAPENRAKGWRLYEHLSPNDQRLARVHRGKLSKLYSKKGSQANVSA